MRNNPDKAVMQLGTGMCPLCDGGHGRLGANMASVEGNEARRLKGTDEETKGWLGGHFQNRIGRLQRQID